MHLYCAMVLLSGICKILILPPLAVGVTLDRYEERYVYCKEPRTCLPPHTDGAMRRQETKSHLPFRRRNMDRSTKNNGITMTEPQQDFGLIVRQEGLSFECA